MSKNSFFDNCCCGKNGNKPNSCTDENSNPAYLMIFIVFIIFMGVPFGNDCFWHGYCNAYNTSGFSCQNQGNSVFNSNTNSNGLFGNFQQQNNNSGSNSNNSLNDLFSNLQQQFTNSGTNFGGNNSLSNLFNSFQQQ